MPGSDLQTPNTRLDKAVTATDAPIAAPGDFIPLPLDALGSDIPVSNPGETAASAIGQAEPVRLSAIWSVWWKTVLFGIWCIGAALLILRLASGHRRLRRMLRDAEAVPEWVLAEVHGVASALGCRRAVEVRCFHREKGTGPICAQHPPGRSGKLDLSPFPAVPFLYGLRRPTLVLPERMCEPAYRPRLPAILAHELAHVGSCDFGWNAILQAASIVLWFHPLAWRIASAHRAACDAVCDAVSASYLGDVRDYCRTLARVALEGAGPLPAAGLAMARTCDVRRRIARLERKVFSAALSRRVVATAAMVGLLTLTLLAGVRLALAEVPRSTLDSSGSNRQTPGSLPDKPAAAPDAKSDRDDSISLADAVRAINEQAAKLPESRTQKPLTENEVIQAIDGLGRDRLSDEDYQKLKQIATTRRLPKDAALWQFVRYNDDTAVEHGWWVRLMMQRESPRTTSSPIYSGAFSLTIRQASLFRRTYTQQERLFQEECRRTGSMPTLGRLVVYFDEDPKFGQEQKFSAQEADRLAEAVKKAVEDRNANALMEAYDWEGVDPKAHAAVRAEAERIVKRRLASVTVSLRRFGGRLQQRLGFTIYDSNLPVLGYVVLEFADGDGPKSISLEFGQTKESMRLVNSVIVQDDTSRWLGKPLPGRVSVQGFQMVDLGDGWMEMYERIEAPDELPGLKNANYELWKINLNSRTESPPKTSVTNPDGKMLIRVVDEAGNPIAGAKLRSDYRGGKTAGETDADGKAELTLPAPDAGYIYLYARRGICHATQGLDESGRARPASRRVHLHLRQRPHHRRGGPRRAGQADRGRQGSAKPAGEEATELGPHMVLWDKYFPTDAEGRWKLEHVPETIDNMHVTLQHDEYITDYLHFFGSDPKLKHVQDQTSVLVMKKGLSVAGTVTDPEGKPVADALVAQGEDRNGTSYPSTRTDAEGRYRFGNFKPGGGVLTVISPGLAPAIRNLNVQSGMKPVDFRLEKGNVLRLRIVDKDNRPIQGVFVSVDTWRGHRTLADLGLAKRTDAEGRWSWPWAPSDAVEIRLSKDGFMGADRMPFAAQEAEHVVTLQPALTITGRVIDAETKQPIPKFRVIPGGVMEESQPQKHHWNQMEASDGKNGEYKTVISRPFTRPRLGLSRADRGRGVSAGRLAGHQGRRRPRDV